MPYRSLTHGRVGGGRKGYGRFESIPGNVSKSQAIASNSARGIENTGPIRKKSSGNRQKTKRTLNMNFLMSSIAYGSGEWLGGEGKGHPNAVPQTSVGSTNTFARRAIARRAVTNVGTVNVAGNNGEPSVCPCVANPVKNTKGEIINKT